jgi:serine/threonine protein kinase
MPLDPGTALGPYSVEALIGKGGMGEVYRARDTRLGRSVALKVLPESGAANPEHGERFEREARTIASLSHPHICALFDVGISGHTRYLVMEYLEGDTLADRLRAGPLPIHEALRLGAQIAEALAAAHTHRIIHRDLKPANIKLAPNGAKVLDFGLAKFLDEGTPDSDWAESATEIATKQHTILGTAAYMSPEQAGGGFLDPRTDIWSFGVVLYEMLTGKRLFTGGGTSEVLAAVLRAEFDAAALPPGVSTGLRELLAKLLERDPQKRLGDIAAAAAVLADGPLARPVEPVQFQSWGPRPSTAIPSSCCPSPTRARTRRTNTSVTVSRRN